MILLISLKQNKKKVDKIFLERRLCCGHFHSNAGNRSVLASNRRVSSKHKYVKK